MKKLYFKNNRYTSGSLFDEVKEVLTNNHVDAEEIEIFGWMDSPYGDKHLPTSFYQLVNYGSRDTILVYEDNQYITDVDAINAWEEARSEE